MQIMQQYLDRPVIFSGAGAGRRSRSRRRVRSRAPTSTVLRGLLESQGYELVSDTASGTYRARVKEQAPQRPPLDDAAVIAGDVADTRAPRWHAGVVRHRAQARARR